MDQGDAFGRHRISLDSRTVREPLHCVTVIQHLTDQTVVEFVDPADVHLSRTTVNAGVTGRNRSVVVVYRDEVIAQPQQLQATVQENVKAARSDCMVEHQSRNRRKSENASQHRYCWVGWMIKIPAKSLLFTGILLANQDVQTA